MLAAELAVVYGLIGLGCAIALVVSRRSASAQWGDVILLVTLWPLYGPFVLFGSSTGSPVATAPDHPLLDALRRAEGTPLVDLLPDPDVAGRLSDRLVLAAERVCEIERLLATPELSESAAVARKHQLTDQGDGRAVAAIDGRLQNIRRLQALRSRYVHELNELEELLTQLRVQAEVVRLTGEANDGTRELVSELMARIEGLDEVLDLG